MQRGIKNFNPDDKTSYFFNHIVMCQWVGVSNKPLVPDKTQGQGSFGPLPGGLIANLVITTQKFKKEERTVHWTRFTKAG